MIIPVTMTKVNNIYPFSRVTNDWNSSMSAAFPLLNVLFTDDVPV
jgi:hypothetical protein